MLCVEEMSSGLYAAQTASSTSRRKGMAATIAHRQDRKRKYLDGPAIYAWLLTVIGMISIIAAAYFPEIGPLRPLKALSVFLFRSIWMVRLVYILAVAAHVGEAVYAYRLAKRVDPANSRGWFWPTFVLGIFSLRFLLKRAQSTLFVVFLNNH